MDVLNLVSWLREHKDYVRMETILTHFSVGGVERSRRQAKAFLTKIKPSWWYCT